MSSKPKVFVITAYSGEGEFLHACEMIHAQKDVEVTHYIVSHRPIDRAFDQMYQAWERVKTEHDYMVQLDADMVFANDTVLINQITILRQNPHYNQVSAPVYDFYTQGYLWGWHLFDPTVRFNRILEEHKHKPDKILDTSNLRILSMGYKGPTTVLHAHSPTLRTAFHFGWHRCLRKHGSPIQRVREIYKNTQSVFHGHAAAGADAADLYMRENNGDIDPIEYNSPIFQEVLAKYESSLQNG